LKTKLGCNHRIRISPITFSDGKYC